MKTLVFNHKVGDVLKSEMGAELALLRFNPRSQRMMLKDQTGCLYFYTMCGKSIGRIGFPGNIPMNAS